MSEIRGYLPQDREKAAAVFLVGMIRNHPFLPQELWLERYRRLYRTQLSEDSTLLAEADGEIEGMLCLGGAGEITALAVGPSCRHKGHAGALLAAAKARFCPLKAWIYAENEEGVAFLKGAGFSVEGESVDPDSGHLMLEMVWQAGGE